MALVDLVWRSEEVSGPLALSWRAKGSCRGSDPSVFYPSPDDETLAHQAKMICGVCPVRRPCLEYALVSREKHGVWGGMTERERRRILRQRRKTA